MADTTYTPSNSASRRTLAVAIHRALVAREFVVVPNARREGEVTYRRPADAGIDVVVYSSIDWSTGKARPEGADAIRVCAVYDTSDGKTRGLAKETRVNRTGTVEGIVGRMMARGAAVWSKVADSPKCRACGAPTFESKKGSQVCAELCWLKKESDLDTDTAITNEIAAHCRLGFTLNAGSKVEVIDNGFGAHGGTFTTKTARDIPAGAFNFADADVDGYFVNFTLNGERLAINSKSVR